MHSPTFRRVVRVLVAITLFLSAASIVWGQPGGGVALLLVGIWALAFASRTPA